jgi:hypothetical protein
MEIGSSLSPFMLYVRLEIANMDILKQTFNGNLELQMTTYAVSSFEHYPDSNTNKLVINLNNGSTIIQNGFEINEVRTDKRELFKHLMHNKQLSKAIITAVERSMRQAPQPNSYIAKQMDLSYGVYFNHRKVAILRFSGFNVEKVDYVTDRGILTFYTGIIKPIAVVSKRLNYINVFPKTFTELYNRKLDTKEKLLKAGIVGNTIAALVILSNVGYSLWSNIWHIGF